MATLTTSVPARPASAPSDSADAAMIQVADFEAVFLRFQGPITHFITHAVGNREQAFDLAQDVFVKAYKALLGGTVIPQRALPAWLYRIAASTITDSLRKQHYTVCLPLSLFDEKSGVGENVFSPSMGTTTVNVHTRDEEDERNGWMTMAHPTHKQSGFDGARFEERVADRQIIERVFGRMSPKSSACLWLYEHEGLSCPEIAEALHISVSAAKMRLQRARERFLALYRGEIGGVEAL